MNSIRNLDLLLTIAVGYIGFIGEKSDEQITLIQLVRHSKRIYNTQKFIFYAIADGLFAVLAKCKQGIHDMLKRKPKFLQLSIFPDIGFTCA